MNLFCYYYCSFGEGAHVFSAIHKPSFIIFRIICTKKHFVLGDKPHNCILPPQLNLGRLVRCLRPKGNGLLNRRTVTCTVGSNPTPSPHSKSSYKEDNHSSGCNVARLSRPDRGGREFESLPIRHPSPSDFIRRAFWQDLTSWCSAIHGLKDNLCWLGECLFFTTQYFIYPPNFT